MDGTRRHRDHWGFAHLTQQRARLGALGLAGALALGGVAALAGPASATGGTDRQANRFSADLDELNDSGTHGTATVRIKDGQLHGKVRVRGAVPLAPHAQHIHFGEQARNECPSLSRDDADGNGMLSTLEGAPAYGPTQLSFTTTGDTSPASGLAVDRFPVANQKGFYNYNRSGIPLSEDLADDIRDEEAVVDVHGVDYNGNGVYDFEGGGASDLDPAFPAEATDPAACGVLTAR